MQIEMHLQPNCSDLVLMLSGRRDTTIIKDTIKRIRSLKVDIGIGDYNKQNVSQMDEEEFALIMKLNEDNGGDCLTNVDRLQLIGKLRKKGMSEEKIKQFLKDSKEGLYTYVMKGKAEVSLRLSDGYGSDGICVMTGDCEESTFPILKKLQDEFAGEVYSVDGGHIDNWEEFIGKENEDE